MEEAVLLDMTTEDIKNENPIRTEKFCTEWTCVRKHIKFITLDGKNVSIEELGEKKIIEGGTNSTINGL